MGDHGTRLAAEIRSYYDDAREGGRLLAGSGRVELARTRELLRRHLPPPPARLLDVGGGTGIYAHWLAGEGYEVHLIDPIPAHIEDARETSRRQRNPIAGFVVGDARVLDFEDECADGVLLLGPLYHLTEREDRVRALAEARRVLRPGGLVAAAVISRFASTLDGLVRGFLDDPEFQRICARDRVDGQHRNPGRRPGYFTTAYFHHPDEVVAELSEAALTAEAVLAIEGPAWLLQDLDEHWDDPGRRQRLLEAIGALEGEPSLLGASAHLLALARR